MADVYAVVFIIAGILLTTPALLVGIHLLLPRMTACVHERLEKTPVKCLFLGLPVMLTFLTWILITSQAGTGVVQATAFLAALAGKSTGALGGTGLARLLGDRLRRPTDSAGDLKAFLRGAVVFELACLAPLVGWFVFAPLAGTAALGAATFAILGWSPKAPAAEDRDTDPALAMAGE